MHLLDFYSINLFYYWWWKFLENLWSFTNVSHSKVYLTTLIKHALTNSKYIHTYINILASPVLLSMFAYGFVYACIIIVYEHMCVLICCFMYILGAFTQYNLSIFNSKTLITIAMSKYGYAWVLPPCNSVKFLQIHCILKLQPCLQGCYKVEIFIWEISIWITCDPILCTTIQ